ncbi:MarR family transcriptional regulator [Actinophytocola sp.]|uniref:MarR family winged helix-turn-helix transcriptional regulator n=1 Tax=Actinophytocola sp. TaxID=1872138 RepID=UPI002D7E9259|nr:MarR family transcriptional regulator [Actinophytocola sp.]HET9142459.1 MarR family transcriptional regulator [Actinophytocola sp.]
MPQSKVQGAEIDDVDAVTDAVLTASRLLVAVSARSIAAVDDSITLPQFRLLVVLHARGQQKIAGIAENLGVNPSTATRAVDRLLTAGLVDRQTNPNSRREMQISLTPAGRRLVRNVARRRRQEIARIVENMPATHRRGLVRALTAFSQAGGEPPASASPYDADDTDWA